MCQMEYPVICKMKSRNIMSLTIRIWIFLLLAIYMVNAEFTLRHLGTDYIPMCYDCESPYMYNKDITEQISYDQNGPYIYSVGLNLIHVIDYSNPASPTRVAYKEFPNLANNGEITDIEVCGDYIGVSIDDFAKPKEGRAVILRRYSEDDGDAEKMRIIHDIMVGTVPDMVKFTSDCSTLVVAIEGELRADTDGTPFDPEGGVAVIDFDDEEAIIRIADFKKFNDRAEEFIGLGVRWVYRGEGLDQPTTFSQDLEPEYITIDKHDKIAYVALQENNAIAVVDIASAQVTDLKPLSRRLYQEKGMDASDRDGGIKITPWPIYGMNQPDGIKYITIGDEDYILTADEGVKKDYELPIVWSEAKRAKKFTDDELDASIPEALRAQLSNDEELGRLEISTVDGRLPNGKFGEFFSYGMRSFSLFKVEDFSMVYNSGDQLERLVAENYPTIFNSNPNSNAKTPEAAMDTRSDNRGPEPEAVETAYIDGEHVVFVGLERPGFVVVYTIDDSGETPTFNYQSIQYGGGYNKTYEALYDAREARDIGPEDLKFISADASENPTGKNLLAVVGAYTGTVSLFEVVNEKTESPDAIRGPERQVGTDEDEDNASSSSLSSGAIAGIVLGVMGTLGTVLAAVAVRYRKQQINTVKVSENGYGKDTSPVIDVSATYERMP